MEYYAITAALALAWPFGKRYFARLWADYKKATNAV